MLPNIITKEAFAMASIAQISENEQREIKGTLKKFFTEYHLSGLLKMCRAEKQKGHSAFAIFQYLLCLVFGDRSMYMQIVTGRYEEEFSKNAVYRFLASARTNWERLVCILSERIINGAIRKLTSENRQDAFVIDDTMFTRTGGKKTELCSKVFDHVTMKMKRGYRLLTLGWTDGNTFLPIYGRLLASSTDKNIIGTRKETDSRSLAGKRRNQAVTKAPDVMIEMLKSAMKAGHRAKYVLFDTWFSTPKSILRIYRECKLHTSAMVKKSPKVFSEFEGKYMTLKEIYDVSKKKRGRAKCLLSVTVNLMENKKAVLPVKIVYFRNRNKRKDWVAFLSTNTSLSDEEIARIYGKRWEIEVFFKACKSMLHLSSECHCLSYDALTAHVSLVFIRYMFLSLQQRCNADDRTISELFLLMVDEMEDIALGEALQIIVDIMLQTMQEQFGLTDDQLAEFVSKFYDRLPISYQHALRYAA